MDRRPAKIEVAPAGRDPSGSRLVRRPRLDRLRAAGLPAVRPGSASRPALFDQARPVSTRAWLSPAGVAWIFRHREDRVALLVWSTLYETRGTGRRFWTIVLSAADEISDALVAAVNAEDRQRWER